LLERQVTVAETLLRLIELRFTQGLASSVDVLQQRDEVAALRQQFPFARLARITAQNEMRQIGALTPERPAPLAIEALPEVSGSFPRIEPIELLDRRSSLRASKARIEAADADFAAALADRWPTLSLSGGVLTRAVSGDVTTLVSAALGAALTLFDSGSKIAIAAERRAWLAAAGEQYLADWVAAVIEVDNLINEEASLRQRIALSEKRLKTAKALLIAAQQRYARGVSDYLPALAALRGEQQQQRDHLALQAELARSRIRLHRALGYPHSV
jgi:outer membrane protein TolC